MKNLDERLKYLVNLYFSELGNRSIRGIVAYWKEDTAKICIYLSYTLNDLEKEDIDCKIAEIIAQFKEGFFNTDYTLLPDEKSLPESQHWAYIRLSEEEFKYAKLISTIKFSLIGRYAPLLLKGVAVDWQNSNIKIYFYTYALPEKWLEAAFVGICAEIAYQYPNEKVEKQIIQVGREEKLPEHKYWTYKREE